MTGRPFCVWGGKGSGFGVQEPRRRHPIAHGPGPPQRPHMGPASLPEDLEAPSEETAANTLSARAVWVEPQSGQGTFSVELMERISFSNRLPQGLHWYS